MFNSIRRFCCKFISSITCPEIWKWGRFVSHWRCIISFGDAHRPHSHLSQEVSHLRIAGYVTLLKFVQEFKKKIYWNFRIIMHFVYLKNIVKIIAHLMMIYKVQLVLLLLVFLLHCVLLEENYLRIHLYFMVLVK